MPYLVHCKDRPGVGALRQEALADHFAYVEAVLDKIAVAGPMKDKVGGEIVGSCFIYHTDDEAEARALFENDPYYQVGLYREVDMVAFTAAAGSWIGGKIW